MIYRMSRDIEAALQARKFPLHLAYAPERTEREALGVHSNVIVVERDRERGDGVEAVHGTQRNARLSLVRLLGFSCKFWVRSSLPGARVPEHENLCDQFVDALMVALREWSVEAKVGVTFGESRYLKSEEFNETEAWPGVVYLLRCQVQRGVRALDYEGQAKPTGTPSGVTNQTQVRLAGDDGPPEIGCG